MAASTDAAAALRAAKKAAEDAEYKRLHEAFVTDHYGSSFMDINQVTIVAPAAVLLWSVLQARLKVFQPYSPLAYLADFLLNCGGILFATTVYADNVVVLVGLLLLPALSIYLNHSKAQEIKKDPKKTDDKTEGDLIDSLPVRPFITHYRGALLVITCVCILAVDFPVFPRRFAKTESIGNSLMDLGVGSFVFAGGVVSVRNQLKVEDGEIPKPSFLSRMIKSIRSVIPLLLLGFVRLYSVKKLNYAEHVTEYGVHWNFFFTLAAIGPFVTLFEPLAPLIPSLALPAFIISLTMEVLTHLTKMHWWLVFAPRDTFLNANREGIASLPGYLAIFLAGQAIGRAILQRDQDPDARDAENDLWLAETLGGSDKVKAMRRSHRRFAWLALIKYTGIFGALYVLLTGKYGPRLIVSRRFANLAYWSWVVLFNTAQLLIFCTIESLFFPDVYLARHKKVEAQRVKRATSKVLNAFNRNALFVFLLANLLTGAINMNLKTIQMGDTPAMAVLLGYMAALTVVALVLDKYDISIKL